MNRWHNQDGSLPLALLISIIVGGLAVTLVATTMTGVQSVRNDREFQTAINGADAAMHQAVTYISQLPDGEPPACQTGVPGNGCVISSDFLGFGDGGVVELGDQTTFEWTAEQVNESLWQLRGTGDVNGVTRAIEARIAKEAFFTMGAFGDAGFGSTGGNQVISYSDSVSDAGRGSVGTNGTIRLVGNSRADIAMLFGPATCEQNTNGCKPENITTQTFPQVFDVDSVYDAIREYRDEQCPTMQPTLEDKDIVWNGGQVYCYSSIRTPQRSEVLLSGASPENPVIIVVDGLVEFGRHSEIFCGAANNCSSNMATSRPQTASLQIYSLGDEVRIGGQGQFAFALAAPKANCTGNPSNAQASIYGSLVCGDLRNQGGWEFAFDEDLLNVSMGQWRVEDWREESPSTSSF